MPGQREEALHHRVAIGRVAVIGIAMEEPAILAGPVRTLGATGQMGCGHVVSSTAAGAPGIWGA
jgi:hypothetical protein